MNEVRAKWDKVYGEGKIPVMNHRGKLIFNCEEDAKEEAVLEDKAREGDEFQDIADEIIGDVDLEEGDELWNDKDQD